MKIDWDYYPIDVHTKTNLQTLLEGLQANGNDSQEALHSWWLGEQEVIKQLLIELGCADMMQTLETW